MTPKGFIIMKVTQKLNMTHEMEMTLKLSISITAVTTLFPNAFPSVVDIKGIKKPPYLSYARVLKLQCWHSTSRDTAVLESSPRSSV